jgi:HTH-type transcriptional regulator, glycine betaine synthesis regulator
MSSELQHTRDQLVESAGRLTQSTGLGRSLGQIFMHIYLHKEPQTLDDLTQALSISKGGASMAVRQLEQWGALKKRWVKGDRKDYYEATEDFGRMVRRAMLDVVGRRIEETDRVLNEAVSSASSKHVLDADAKFMIKRIKKLQTFRDRAKWIWNRSLIKLLLK